MRISTWIGVVALVAAAVWGQTAAPAFEVASIKPNAMRSGSWMRFQPGGRFSAMSWVKQMIQVAYGVEDYQVSDGPDWVRADRYDFEAKAANPEATQAEIKLMLRTLLAERFQLKLRQEMKEFSVYYLYADQGASKLRPLEDGKPSLCNGNNSEICGMTSMESLAQLLRNASGRPVFDKTGITGKFDILLAFDIFEAHGQQPPPDYNKPPLMKALKDQLGMRLEPQKATLPYYVIESIQRPTAN